MHNNFMAFLTRYFLALRESFSGKQESLKQEPWNQSSELDKL